VSVEHQLKGVCPSKGTAVTIGTFDGVHRGHQHLFRSLKDAAQANDLLTCAIVFRNQPRSVLVSGAQVEYITPWEERKALIEAQGVDHLVALNFTRELASVRAQDFVEMLVADLKMKALVVGPDFALGHRREGDIPALRVMGRELGFHVQVLEPKAVDKQPIRSRILRRIISDGRVADAARMLGRPFALQGEVVEGDRRGRELGFPTANLALDDSILAPKHGIYATWASFQGEKRAAATSIGVRPTFGGGPRFIEVYVMDFDGDIYGETMDVEFVRLLRDEQYFESVPDLVSQMERDVEQARGVLSGVEAGT
jgi:riboflavin kinase/FMN adenylyltransferase